MSFKSFSHLIPHHDGKVQNFCRAGSAICILIVCVLPLLPKDEVPDISQSDKIVHFIAFGVIVTLGLLGFRGFRATIFIVIGVIALGAALEIGQLFVPGRSADIVDFTANCAGVVVGLFLARLIPFLWKHRAGLTKEERDNHIRRCAELIEMRKVGQNEPLSTPDRWNKGIAHQIADETGLIGDTVR